MSYNNIGLTTPRGSGTSGYVQRNLSHVQPRDNQFDRNKGNRYEDKPAQHRKPDASILEHERKRRIENKCVELQLDLEDQSLDEEEIEKRVDELRQKLMKEDMSRQPGTIKPHETHEIAAMKARENEKFRSAMGVNTSYVEGQAFDKELQAERKLQAIEERQNRETERANRLVKLQEERAKWEKERQDKSAAGRAEAEKELNARREEAERRKIQLGIDSHNDRRRPSESDRSNRLLDRIHPAARETGHRPQHDRESAGGRPTSRRPSSRSPPRSARHERHSGSRRSGDGYRPAPRRPAISPRRSRSISRSSSSSDRGRLHSRPKSYSRSPSPPSRSRRRSPSGSPRYRRRSRSPPRPRSPLLRPPPSPSRSPASPRKRHRVRPRSISPDRRPFTRRSASPVKSDTSNRSRSPPKHQKRSATPPPPPGFRRYDKEADRSDSPRRSHVSARSGSRSPSPSPSRPPSRSRSHSRSISEGDRSMDMSDASQSSK